jgi:hypothetical protein
MARRDLPATGGRDLHADQHRLSEVITRALVAGPAVKVPSPPSLVPTTVSGMIVTGTTRIRNRSTTQRFSISLRATTPAINRKGRAVTSEGGPPGPASADLSGSVFLDQPGGPRGDAGLTHPVLGQTASPVVLLDQPHGLAVSSPGTDG